MQISSLRSDELTTLAQFIATLNQDPEHNISYFGTDADEIESSLRDFTPAPTESVLVLWQAQHIIGMFGFDQDTDIGRAWLYGPLLDLTNEDWRSQAQQLYDALINRMDKTVRDWEMVFDYRNQRGQQFAQKQGFVQSSHDLAMVLTRVTAPILKVASAIPEPAVPLAEHHQLSFIALHNQLFPKTYYSGQEIVEIRSAHAEVFVIADAQHVTGYLFAKVEPDFGEGTIEFVGVAPEVRRHGLGNTLLGKALHWMFSFEGVEKIGLTVDKENSAATQLYRKHGFYVEKEIVAFRKR